MSGPAAIRPLRASASASDAKATPPPGTLGVVHRLDAQAIPGQQQPAAARVPQREGEHPAQPREQPLGVAVHVLVEMDQHLGVGVRSEPMPCRLELGPQLREPVQLAVEHDLDGAVLVRDRLVRMLGQVDDPQTRMAEHARAVPGAERGAAAPPRGLGAEDQRGRPPTSSVEASAAGAAVPRMPHISEPRLSGRS